VLLLLEECRARVSVFTHCSAVEASTTRLGADPSLNRHRLDSRRVCILIAAPAPGCARCDRHAPRRRASFRTSTQIDMAAPDLDCLNDGGFISVAGS
jgi:hypothetical protein